MSNDEKYLLEAQEPNTSADAPASAGGDVIQAPLVTDGGDDSFEHITQMSQKVPVVLDFWADWCGPCRQLGPAIEAVVKEMGGQVQLVKVDVDANQMLAQAFQIQGIPAVFGLVAGQPVPLFQGAVPKAQVKGVIEQLIEAAHKAGVTGRISDANADAKPEPTPEEKAVQEALEKGDFDEAERLLTEELEKHPNDKDIEAALNQVRLHKRLTDEDEAGADDSDPLVLADRFVKNGNSPAAYQVLLDALRDADGDDKDTYRKRIVELFSVDTDKQAVSDARRKLSRLLF